MSELRNQIYEIQRSLGRIEGSLNELKEDVSNNNDNQNLTNNRIGKLENDKHWQRGAAAMIALGASYIFSIFKI